MTIYLETDRTILREAEPSDLFDFFALDSDPEVHRFLGNHPVKSLVESEEMIASLKQQYHSNGIGRWVIEQKETGDFIGWSGLKYEEQLRTFAYYDLGYRLNRAYWNQGYATETARACLDYGFKHLNLPAIGAAAEQTHLVSNHILKKLGLKPNGTFIYEEAICNWYWLTKDEWIEGDSF